jgi:hypothetical protein
VQRQLVRGAKSGLDQEQARKPFVGPILAVYLASRLLLLLVLLDLFGPHRALIKLAGIWDGSYYLQIAAHGYPNFVAHHGNPDAALFPLYPVLVRIAEPVFGDDGAMTGIIVSLLTGAAACLAVGALARDRAGTVAGVRAGWLVALAPGALFLSLPYPEGLAIALCASALLMLDRRLWLAAGLLGGLATAASSLALPIVVAAGWAAWRSGQRRAWFTPILAASGFASYCVYLWVHSGTPFGWFDAERYGWDGHHFDLASPVRWFMTWSGITLVETLCIGAVVAGLWAMYRARVPGTWWAFALPLLASVTFDSQLSLRPRFLLAAIPLIAAVAILASGQRFRMLVVASGIAMVLVVVAYLALPGFAYQP